MSTSPFHAAVHALDLEEPAWIATLFDEGRALFDEGDGLFVYSYRVGTQPPLRLGALAGEHTAPSVWQTLATVGLSTVSTFARRARNKLGCRPGTEAFLTTVPGAGTRRSELFSRLTASECDVAADLLLGHSYADMALKRGSSPRTIAAQCSLIFRKCGVTGRRALAAAVLDGAPTSGK